MTDGQSMHYQSAFYALHRFSAKSKWMLATYTRRMCNNNPEIRIAGWLLDAWNYKGFQEVWGNKTCDVSYRDFKFNFGCISHNSCPVCMVCYNANGNGKEPLFYIRSSKYMCSHLLTNKPGPRLVVQKVESDLYSVDNAIGFSITYPLDSNLYSG